MTDKKLNDSIEKCFKKCFPANTNQVAQKGNLISILNSHKTENYIHHYPLSIFWIISSACNLRCEHCFYSKHQHKFENKNDLTTEELLKLAAFFVEELNILSFKITGGEPFLQKDILILLKYLKSKNVYLTIQTNATLITEEIAFELSKILKPKTDSVQISLDGATAEVHDNIRGKGTFKKTISAIEKLTKNNINVSISYTATSANLEDFSKLYKLCKDLKINKIMVGRFKACSEEQEYLIPPKEKVFIKMADLIEEMAADKSTMNLKLANLKTYDFLNFETGKNLLDNYLKDKTGSCPENCMCHNHDKITVSGDGKIYLCPQADKDELVLGNLKEKTFFEIWENRFNNIFFQERNLKNSVCKKCPYISLCSAGCAAKAYDKYGDINAPDSDCVYAQKLIKESKENLC